MLEESKTEQSESKTDQRQEINSVVFWYRNIKPKSMFKPLFLTKPTVSNIIKRGYFSCCTDNVRFSVFIIVSGFW